MDERNRRILALLSHPSRVKLIELLGRKALQTDEMAEKMPIELAGTVVHLNYLINEGVVHSKRYGRRVKYWLDRERFSEALADLCDEIGIRVAVNKSFKQDAPDGPDLPFWPKSGKKTPKTRHAAKKKATKKRTAKKKATKKRTAKKKATKKRTAKKKAKKRSGKKR
jgi:hypothetical protein